MKTNYILVDYENVHPEALPKASEIPLQVHLFVGDKQMKIPYALAEGLQALGANASYVKIEGNGSNALDFHIAYFIGKIAEQDDNAYFHIVSKDKGFDPLIRYLKKNKVLAQRVESISDIAILNDQPPLTLPEKVEYVIARLQNMGSSKPRRVKTLESTIHSIFMKNIQEPELQKIMKKLTDTKTITLNDQVVSYQLPV